MRGKRRKVVSVRTGRSGGGRKRKGVEPNRGSGSEEASVCHCIVRRMKEALCFFVYFIYPDGAKERRGESRKKSVGAKLVDSETDLGIRNIFHRLLKSMELSYYGCTPWCTGYVLGT